MATETILQHWLFTMFAFPFLLIFALVYGILEKTKILGDGKHQLNAIVALVMGLIFVSVAYPTEVVNNLVLFLTVALVVVLVVLMLWGFVSGSEGPKIDNTALKWIIGIGIVVIVIIALLWATGNEGKAIDILFGQSWSNTLWTNILFIVVVGVALAVVVKSSS